MSNNGSLLVVDDNELNRDMLSRRLRRNGYDADVAADGQSALDSIAGREYDLVLLDIEMPGMTGLEVLERLRTVRSADDLPIIVVSARHGSESVVAALKLGANDYVTKPVDFPVALARIEVQLARRRRTAARGRCDSISDLPNRAGLMEWWSGQGGSNWKVAVLAINLDRFRIINQAVGLAAADVLLMEVAKRLTSLAPQASLVARVATDEYVCALVGVTATQATDFAERVLASLQQPFQVAGQQISLSASIGLAMDDSGRRAEDVLQEADTALFRAKSLSGPRWVQFEPAMRSRALARLTLEMEMQQALATDAFYLKYQPILSLGRFEIVGFEALARWRHPERGDIAPAEFIPIAEETGLIVPLGAFLLRAACKQATEWRRRLPRTPEFSMAVNISGRQLCHPGFLGLVEQTIDETAMDPRTLKLEITESVLLENSEQVHVVFEGLRGLSVEVALDDFGTGYSSLKYLQDFMPNTLKVDRSFVSGLASASRDVEIVRAVIEVARTLGMRVIAEGIESEAQLEVLCSLGCEYGQGFLFSRPLDPAAAILKLEAGRPLESSRVRAGSWPGPRPV
jgi:diguanylate cyclase (GGDEF)-like protein